MKLTRRPAPVATGINMTPMIDIVFLLLVFFMTVSQITQNMAAEVRLASVDSAGAALSDITVEIMVLADGSLRMDGEPAALLSVAPRLRELILKLGAEPDRLLVQLRIDRDCDSQVVNQLMAQVSTAGVQRLWSVVTTEQPAE